MNACAWSCVGLAALLAGQVASSERTASSKAAAPADFETTEVGQLPAGFTIATTNNEKNATPVAAKWAVAEDAAAPSGKHVVKLLESKNRNEIFNLLLRDEPAPADLTVEVKLRADQGGEDRGGGLVWRLKDDGNYYLCRWNPLEKNLRAYRTDATRRIQLQSVPIAADAAAWHTIAVTMKGRVIEIAFDGRKVLACCDSTFAEGGRVGLWTRSDARSSFDDLKVAPAR